MAVTSIQLPSAEVAVIVLTVACVILIMLPTLNRQLVMVLKNHVYFASYDNMCITQKAEIIQWTKILEELTVRKQEVLSIFYLVNLTGKLLKTYSLVRTLLKAAREISFPNMMLVVRNSLVYLT